jgi:hypothetical protein
VTKRAALLWTFSIASLFFFVCGAQTVEQYSRFDLTIVLNAISFVDSFLIFKFLLKNPSNLFTLLVMFPIWVFQVRLIDNVRTRYFASLTSSNICPLRV